MGEIIMHEDWCSQCVTATSSLKSKVDEKASIDVTEDFEQIFKDAEISNFPAGKITVVSESSEYVPKSERLLAIYDLLTDKSFPRKGKGKSTKIKILDAIVTAALDKKLIEQRKKQVSP